MNIPVSLPLSTPIPGALKKNDAPKKKRVLLVDTWHVSRDLRTDVLRKLGMFVDSAADLAEARSWWRPALYDLVLINMERGTGQRDKFCDDLRAATPPQRLAFFVGQPEYLSHAPNADQGSLMGRGDEPAIVRAEIVSSNPRDLIQRWSILEASRKISAVRCASIARTNAMRALPPPPRDSEGRHRTSLDDLMKE